MASKWDSTRARIKLRRIILNVDNGIKPAMQDAANKLQKEVLMNIPRNTGNLEDLITSYVSKNGLLAEVGLRGKKAKQMGFYLRFLEFGTKGHKVKSGKLLSDGENAFGQNADIPAMPARPALQPAWDREKPAIISRIGKVIEQAVQKAQNL